MLELGQIIKLDNDKEYIVVKKMKLHSICYVFLISNFKPLDIVIAREKITDENVLLEEIKDNDELDYILSKFTLTKDFDELKDEFD